jgi:hypothetical protein
MTVHATPEVRGRRPIVEHVRERFLELLANGWTVRAASKATGHNFGTWYELRREDEDFAKAWAEAWEQGTQAIEEEAFRRAVEGYDETTTDGDGNVLRIVRRYDSALLQTLLRGRRPEMYGQSVRGVIEHTGRIEIAPHARISLEEMLEKARIQGIELPGAQHDVIEDAELLELEAGDDA